jgi:hypothetical protein
MAKHTSHINKADSANKRFETLLRDFQKRNAELIAGNIAPPQNTEVAVKSINSSVKINESTRSIENQRKASMASKANSARLANTPAIKQAVSSPPNLFNLGF